MRQVDKIRRQAVFLEDLPHFFHVSTGSNDALAELIFLTDLAPQISHRCPEIRWLSFGSEQISHPLLFGSDWPFTLGELSQDPFVFLFYRFNPVLVNFAAAMAITVFQFDNIIDDSQVLLIMDNTLGG